MRTLAFLLTLFKFSTQDCAEEVSNSFGLSVIWPSSLSAARTVSKPLCYGTGDQPITRVCNGTSWYPTLKDLEPCKKTVQFYDVDSCPPGFYMISNNNTRYCYEISKPKVWDYPCFRSGGASIITDLSKEDVESLLDSLANSYISNYFWLPARRKKVFNPLVWTVPGPNWGDQVESTEVLQVESSLFSSCLVLDVRNKKMYTKSCNNVFPSLCFYVNDFNYPSQCPKDYKEFRFMPNDDVCFAIQQSDTEVGKTLNDFLQSDCKTPMGSSIYKEDLRRFIFTKMADVLQIPDEKWCWYDDLPNNKNLFNSDNLIENGTNYQVVINNKGTLSLMDSTTKLSCMACETTIIYKQTELLLEYHYSQTKMFLTIYYPSSLWKYNTNDTGVRCFSNANGFFTSIHIQRESLDIEITDIERNIADIENVEKVTYVIDLIEDRTAQYWCEGHTKNFTLISTNKIIVLPSGNNDYVFAIFVEYHHYVNESCMLINFSEITSKINEICSAKNTLLMDILEMNSEYGLMLYHLHIDEHAYDYNKNRNLEGIYEVLSEKCKTEFPKHNFNCLNISSPIFCLPTTSHDIYTLDWELTQIGQITAPKQFCLQANGLPVTRRCLGSYMTGGYWGPVKGYCDENYQPSVATTFLYDFVKDRIDTNYFLTDGLHFVLHDVDILIPADIYYLSMSLHQVSNDAKENKSSVEMSDLDNIAWAVDRLMMLDDNYLNLAQTLNSTNVLLDSVTEIVDVVASFNMTELETLNTEYIYQSAVKNKFVIQISYPKFNNISGIALIKTSDSSLFTDMIIQPLYTNSTLNDVLNIPNLEIASWVPSSVLNTLKPINNETEINPQTLHVIVHIFHNNAIFQELEQRKQNINSRIIEITIPGYMSDLKYSLPLVFRDKTYVDNRYKMCGFWDFQLFTPNKSMPGSWKKSGCFFSDTVNNLTVCKCYHLTHFAQLISPFSFSDRIRDETAAGKHQRVLNIITLIGSTLSLLGIFGIWITAFTFTSWRQKPGSKILLQLSTAIALPLMFLIYFNLDPSMFIEVDKIYFVAHDKKIACIALGASLHYSILAGFIWMLITAVLQFIRFVRVLGIKRPSRFILKLSIIGWGVPLIPVTILLIVDKDNYLPVTASNGSSSGICYPTGIPCILTVIVPIFIILIVNVVLFLLVLLSISRGPDGKMRSTDLDLVKAQLKLSIFLFFLLGLTWVFGIFSLSQKLWWSYMFCLTSTMQGFVLFLFFVICDPATRKLWITLMKPQFQRSLSRQSISSASTTSAY